MGGTTAKAGVIHNGDVLMIGSTLVGGYATGLPVQIPMIDIQEVGTGGGSIARVEDGGALHVGPESAGAQPGPVCYGQGGTEPTITDANLVLGRLGADRFLGGEMRARSRRRHGARSMSASPSRSASISRRRPTASCASPPPRWPTWCAGSPPSAGSTPPTSSLVAYGGAGPLHAAMVARELRIAKVVIPRAPGHFSAYGMLVADLRRDFVNTWFTPLAEASFAAMEDDLRRDGAARPRGRRARARSRLPASRSSAPPTCAMSARSMPSRSSCRSSCSGRRTATASSGASMPCTRPATAIRRPAEKAEIVSLRSAVTGVMRKPAFEPIAAGEAEPPAAAFAARGRSISPKPAVTSTRRPITARAARPAIASPGRR